MSAILDLAAGLASSAPLLTLLTPLVPLAWLVGRPAADPAPYPWRRLPDGILPDPL